VELRSRGPELEMTYVQSLPLGATEIRASASEEGARGRRHRGLHDIQQEMGFTLQQGSPIRLFFGWEGGLEAYIGPRPDLSPGARSGGIRILDFQMDGDEWLLSVEGEGGTEEPVNLLGAMVAVEGEGVEVRREGEGRSVLLIRFPGGEPRVIRTVRLTPAAPSR
jgi:hypothetical protein